jgi:hypothetical protein
MKVKLKMKSFGVPGPEITTAKTEEVKIKTRTLKNAGCGTP